MSKISDTSSPKKLRLRHRLLKVITTKKILGNNLSFSKKPWVLLLSLETRKQRPARRHRITQSILRASSWMLSPVHGAAPFWIVQKLCNVTRTGILPKTSKIKNVSPQHLSKKQRPFPQMSDPEAGNSLRRRNDREDPRGWNAGNRS